jgi:hypothetical protein
MPVKVRIAGIAISGSSSRRRAISAGFSFRGGKYIVIQRGDLALV